MSLVPTGPRLASKPARTMMARRATSMGVRPAGAAARRFGAVADGGCGAGGVGDAGNARWGGDRGFRLLTPNLG